MFRCVLASLSLAALLVAAAPASAAIISQFTYDITGGSVSNTTLGTLLPVSGTLTVTPLTPVTTGPTKFLGQAQISLNLTTSGGATLTFGPLGGLTIFAASANQLILDLTGAYPNSAPGMTNGSAFVWNGIPAVNALSAQPFGAVFFAQGMAGTTFTRTFNLTLGNEVRTVVPEAGTAALIGLGLLVLVSGAGGRHAANGARRRSRE